MVTQYTYENINALEKYNRFKLPKNIIGLIDEYTSLVSSPSYNKSPHFAMKRSIILDSNRNIVQNIQDTIKKLLNKITEKNYDKLFPEILSNLKNLFQECNTNYYDTSNNIINNTIGMIFSNFFVSAINIDLNIKIVNVLSNEFKCFQDYLDNFIDSCKHLENEIEVCKAITFDEIDKINKKNNIVKNKIIFLSKLEMIKKVDKKTINDLIIRYQNLFNNMLKQTFSKMECDELAEIVLCFLNQKDKLDKEDTLESIIIKNIYTIIEADISNKISLTTKIILKHKNILTKLNI